MSNIQMADNISDILYSARVKYSMGDDSAVEQIVLNGADAEFGKIFVKFCDENSEKLYIFGAGILGHELEDTWGYKYKFQGFIDNASNEYKSGKIQVPFYTKWRENSGNIPIVGLDEIEKDSSIIIMVKNHYSEIERQLLEYGIKKEKILNCGELYNELCRKQYFDLDELKISTRIDDVFVDCGVLDGGSSKRFIELNKNIRMIWMFEPDPLNYEKTKDNFKNESVQYKVVNKGVWDSNCELEFSSLGNGNSSLKQGGGIKVSVDTLDSMLAETSPTYIKMDIEGAEINALRGAEKIIRKNHPDLAISIYHKKEDIFEIPKIILDYYPEYRLYLRHYSLSSSETVLYAIAG